MTGKNEPTGEVYYLYHIATTVGDAVDISCPEAYDFELFEALELVNATSSYYGRSQQDSTYVEMRSSYSCEAMKPLGLNPNGNVSRLRHWVIIHLKKRLRRKKLKNRRQNSIMMENIM